MNKKFMYVLMIISLLSLLSVGVFAQEDAPKFSNTLLSIAIVIGIASSLYALLPGLKMKGGTVGTGLVMYAAGMISVVISLLSVTWLGGVFGASKGMVHDVFFIIGFLVVAGGTYKILSAFKGT